MRIATFILTGLLAATSFCAQGAGQVAKKLDAPKEKDMFATNRCFPKGGLGIINSKLYIVLKSTKNELLVDPGGSRWTGQSAPKAEIVFFVDGKVLSPQQLPEAFDLSNAVVVSFERLKIRFFDFRKMSGGYYEREKD